MDESFQKFLDGYNESSLEQFKVGVAQLANISMVFFKGMIDAGFSPMQALELTKQWQSNILFPHSGNNNNTGGV